MVFVLNEPPAGNAALRGQLENRIGFVRGYASWTWRITDQLSNGLSASLSRNVLLLNFGPDIRVDNQAWQLTVREDLEYKYQSASNGVVDLTMMGSSGPSI